MVFGMEVRKDKKTLSQLRFLMAFLPQMFLVNMYLKAYEHSIDIPDYFKLVNTSLLLFSIPVFILKSVIKRISFSQLTSTS